MNMPAVNVTRADRDKALAKAKINLMSRQNFTFWSHVCQSLRHYFSDEMPTAWTDGVSIGYNPGFFMSLTPAQRAFVCFHEVAHNVYMHVERGLTRDKTRYNMAGDYLINLQAKDYHFELIDGVLIDEQYRGMDTDEIYDLLPENPKAPDGMMQDLKDPGECSDQTPQSVAAKMDDILVAAVMAAKEAGDKAGSIPGAVSEYVENLLNPKVYWHAVLKRYMTKFTKKDYSFARPNRRYLPWIIPGLHGKALANIAWAFDLSGSVSQKELTHYVSEAYEIVKALKPEKITSIQFDTRITKVDEVRNVRDIETMSFKGRGGTHIRPVMEWARDNKPTVMLVFTDGHFNPADINPGMDVVWVINNNRGFTAPFGKVIHFELEE